MSDIEPLVIDFFLGLQRSVNAADAGTIAATFAPHLLAASPGGTRLQENDAEFRVAIEQRLALLGQAGVRDVKALQIDPTPLGANYALVRVRWSVWFAPAGRPDFVDEFLFDYLVHLGGDRVEIVVSIAHDDDENIMRRIGLAT